MILHEIFYWRAGMKPTFDSKMAKITVNPSLKTIIDQNVDIFVSNLPSHQDITLRARTIDDSETVFESFAYYKADEDGEVSLVSQPSLGGSYTGVEPMGLFWSMEPVEATDRDDMLRKRDVTKPLKFSIDVYSSVRIGGNNSGSLEENNKLASVTLLRSYMSDGVTRHVVESGGFYGTLFIPSGEGPFPGVIDIWGITGGLREDRAALLAANGFAVLALAYCAFKDLPERYGLLQVSYFESAIYWLTSQPKVKSGGVGLVGLSNGGALALALAAQLGQKVKAVVCISGYPMLIGCSLASHTMTIPGYPVDLELSKGSCYSQFLAIFTSKEICKIGSPWTIPVEHICCPVLLVYGLADQLVPDIEWMCEEIFRRMQQNGKESLCQKLGLPGASHFIAPCYIPPCSREYIKVFDEIWLIGGNDKPLFAKSSKQYWNKSLEFLFKYI